MRWLFVAAMLLLAGCESKSVQPPALLKPDEKYLQALRYTQKCEIALSLETKALLIATYLNPLGDFAKESFLIRIYIEDDFEDEKLAGLYHPGYSLSLNEQNATKITPLQKDDPLLKGMPFTQSWYKFYVVEFPAQKERLRLTLSHKDYGSCGVEFQNISIY